MPPVTKNLIIINLLLFLSLLVGERYGMDLNNVLGLHFFLANDFRLYQLFTYMFMHGGFQHILFNMFAVWMFGRVMESSWGSRRFLVYYLVCGVGAGLVQELAQFVSYLAQGLHHYDAVNVGYMVMSTGEFLNRWTTVGASGAVYGILLAFGMTYPNERLFIFPLPVPIRAKFFVMGYAVLELLLGVGGANDSVAHFAHLGGMIFGLFLILYWRRRGGGGSGWGRPSLTSRIKNWFKTRRAHFTVHQGGGGRNAGRRQQDYDYNAQRKRNEEEIDRILEKVRKYGYGCLTEEEKRRLFDAGQR